MKNFFVVRLVIKPDGTVSGPVTGHETEIEATKQFYKTCAIAIDSTNILDTVMLVDAEGYPLKRESFTHGVTGK